MGLSNEELIDRLLADSHELRNAMSHLEQKIALVSQKIDKFDGEMRAIRGFATGLLAALGVTILTTIFYAGQLSADVRHHADQIRAFDESIRSLQSASSKK